MLIKYLLLYYNKWKLNKLTSAKVNSVVYNFYYAGKLIRVLCSLLLEAMISGIIDMWELVTYSGGVNTTIAAFCQAFDHYFRFEKRNLWIESGLNQESADKSSEDCLVFASSKIDHLFRKEE